MTGAAHLVTSYAKREPHTLVNGHLNGEAEEQAEGCG